MRRVLLPLLLFIAFNTSAQSDSVWSLQRAIRYALDNNITRLSEDHQHVQLLMAALKQKEYVGTISPAETNIIIFNTRAPHTANSIVQRMKEKNVLPYAIGPEKVRLVTHLDIRPEMVQRTIDTVKHL